MALWNIGGSKDADKGSNDSGKSVGEIAKGWFDAAATTIAVAVGAHAATHEPLSPSTFADQAGHYAAIQQEERVAVAIEHPVETAREVIDRRK